MADPRPLMILAPVVGLAVNCLTHIVAARLSRGRTPYAPLAIGAVMGLVTTVVVTVVASAQGGHSAIDTFAFMAMNAAASLGFAFGYFNFVNLTFASLRIRMLEEIASSGGWLSRAALLDRYGTGNVADIRLQRLVDGGHLVERNGRLHTGGLQFLIVARIFDALRGLVFGPVHAAACRRPPGPPPTDHRTAS